MNGIVISYIYSGDEAEWEAVTTAFTDSIAADTEVGTDFMYIVSKSRESDNRTHIGRWKSQTVLNLVQSRDYFKTFAGRLKAMAGDSLKPEGMTVTAMTAQ